MSKKLYVGGLPYSTTEAELEELFSKAGKVVKADLIIDRDSGNSKGFGFVEMESDDDANAAIQMYNDQEYGGRRLTVNEARPKTDRPKGNWGNDKRGGGGGWDNDRSSRRY